MSFSSKWQQFVRWVREHQADELDPTYGPHGQPGETPGGFGEDVGGSSGSWAAEEAKAKGEEFRETSKASWVALGYLVAGYWDAKLGTGNTDYRKQPAPISGNVDVDALLLTGALIGFVLVVWSIVKRWFQ